MGSARPHSIAALLHLPESPLNAPLALAIAVGCLLVGCLLWGLGSDKPESERSTSERIEHDRGRMFAFLFLSGCAFFGVMGLGILFGLIDTGP